MNYCTKSLTVAALAVAVACPAFADTLVITYASGEVQTVTLSGPAKDIQDVSVGETSVPLSEKVRNFLLGKPPASDQARGKESAGAAKKQSPLLKWAPPVSE